MNMTFNPYMAYIVVMHDQEKFTYVRESYSGELMEWYSKVWIKRDKRWGYEDWFWMHSEQDLQVMLNTLKLAGYAQALLV